MVVVKQGQVEVGQAPVVTDLKDSEMIPKNIVQVPPSYDEPSHACSQELNVSVVALGGDKVDVLKEITVSRTAINLLKWTKKKLSLEHKDAVDLTTELQLLRVTKNLQSLIKMGGHDNQQAAELKRLDRKIEFLNHATREKGSGCCAAVSR
jgi:hypothetical protein